MACFACICVGVASMAASTTGCERHSPRSVLQCGILYLVATSMVDAALPPASVTTSIPGMLAIASMCLMPKAPCPAMQTFMNNVLRCVFENEMTERRVRRGHVIEAVDLLHLWRQRAARDEPHDHL